MSVRRRVARAPGTEEIEQQVKASQPESADQVKQDTKKRRSPLGWFISGLFFPLWLVWLLVSSILALILFPFGGWRQKPAAGPKKAEKELETLNKEEASIASRMEKRRRIWKSASWSILMYSAVAEVVLVGVAFILLRASADAESLGDPLLAPRAAWERLFKRWLLFLSPVLFLPGACGMMYSLTNRAFKARERKDAAKLQSLREQQKKQLEELLNESSFKKTLQLLQKYGGKDMAASGLFGDILPPQPAKGASGTPKSHGKQTPGQHRWQSPQEQRSPAQGQWSPAQGQWSPAQGQWSPHQAGQGGPLPVPLPVPLGSGSASRNDPAHAGGAASGGRPRRTSSLSPGDLPSEAELAAATAAAAAASPEGQGRAQSLEYPLMPGSPPTYMAEAAGDAGGISHEGLRRRSVGPQNGGDSFATGEGAEGAGKGRGHQRRASVGAFELQDGDLVGEGHKGAVGATEGGEWLEEGALEEMPGSGFRLNGAFGGEHTSGVAASAFHAGPGFRAAGGQFESHEGQDNSSRGGWLHRDGFLGRLAGMLVGEDPRHCFALICRNCHTHNGLARAEDFPYLSYICPRCSFFNKAPCQEKPEAVGSSEPPQPVKAAAGAGGSGTADGPETSPEDQPQSETGAAGEKKHNGGEVKKGKEAGGHPLEQDEPPAPLVQERTVNERADGSGRDVQQSRMESAAADSAASQGSTEDSEVQGNNAEKVASPTEQLEVSKEVGA